MMEVSKNSEIIEKNKFYPLAQAQYGYRVKWTGEIREPKAGEWYLSGAIIEGYRAKFDLHYRYPIGKLIRVRKVEYWEEVEDDKY